MLPPPGGRNSRRRSLRCNARRAGATSFPWIDSISDRESPPPGRISNRTTAEVCSRSVPVILLTYRRWWHAGYANGIRVHFRAASERGRASQNTNDDHEKQIYPTISLFHPCSPPSAPSRSCFLSLSRFLLSFLSRYCPPERVRYCYCVHRDVILKNFSPSRNHAATVGDVLLRASPLCRLMELSSGVFSFLFCFSDDLFCSLLRRFLGSMVYLKGRFNYL